MILKSNNDAGLDSHYSQFITKWQMVWQQILNHIMAQELSDLYFSSGTLILVSETKSCRGSNMSNQREITYSIGETEKLTGASQKQIRYWESRYISEPIERNVCGDIAYRRFTQGQVELIHSIKMYLDQGYTLARAAELARNGRDKISM